MDALVIRVSDLASYTAVARQWFQEATTAADRAAARQCLLVAAEMREVVRECPSVSEFRYDPDVSSFRAVMSKADAARMTALRVAKRLASVHG